MPNNKRRYTKTFIQRVIDAYQNRSNEESAQDIARQFKVKASTIWGWQRKLGLGVKVALAASKPFVKSARVVKYNPKADARFDFLTAENTRLSNQLFEATEKIKLLSTIIVNHQIQAYKETNP